MRKRLAKLISNILNPFLVSFAVIILISFESTPSTPDALKWASISLVLSVLPVFAVVVYLVRKKKLDDIFINSRRQRKNIYLLASTLAVAGWVILYFLGAPVLLMATFTAGLAAIFIFMVTNFFWKISLHTAFIAASVAILIIIYRLPGVMAVVLLPPVTWARMEMKLHTPAQVTTGALLAAAVVVTVFHFFGLIGTRA